MADQYQQYPGYPPPQQQGGGYPPYPSAQQPPLGQPTIGFVNPGYPMTPPQQQQGGSMPYPSGYGQQQPQFKPLVPPQPQPYVPGPGIHQGQHSGGYDPEDPMGPEVKGFDFSEESIRKGFIRKVYSILSVQLFITLSFIFIFRFNDNALHWMSTHMSMFYVSLIVMFATLIAMACCENVRRKSPVNLIVLFIFTLAESYLVAASTMRFKKDDVALAIGITTAVCIGLTIFAFQTKWDFTMFGGILFVLLILLLLMGIIAIFIPGKVMVLIYSSCGALLFCVYLIYDTQLMMGGKHKHSISPEEYVFAALNLYLDIINIFIYILSIIGASKD